MLGQTVPNWERPKFVLKYWVEGCARDKSVRLKCLRETKNSLRGTKICSQVLGRRVWERRTSCDRDQPPPPSTQPTVCNATATTTNQPHNQNTNWTVLQLDIFGFLYFDQTSSNPLPPSAQPNQSFATANRKHHQPTNKQGKNKQKSVRPKLYLFFYFFQV